MKKRKNIIIFVLVLLCFVFISLKINKDKNNNSFINLKNESELLLESKEGNNIIQIYKKGNVLIINAKSETNFFNGVQFEIHTNGNVRASDIDIKWTTIGGSTMEKAFNKKVISEIKIKEEGVVIFYKKINFLKKAFEDIDDVMEKNKNNISNF